MIEHIKKRGEDRTMAKIKAKIKNCIKNIFDFKLKVRGVIIDFKIILNWTQCVFKLTSPFEWISLSPK